MSNFAEAGDGLGDGLYPTTLVGDIKVNKQALASDLVDSSLGLPPVFIQDVSDDYLGTFTGKQFGLCGTHTSGSATNQSYLVL